MLARVHIHQLFVGQMDHKTNRDNLLGVRAPDGKVWIKEGGKRLDRMRRDYLDGSGPRFQTFMKANPGGMVEVNIVDAPLHYNGRRQPASLAVNSFVLWVDFDSFARKLIVHECQRKAYETLIELKQRLLEDSVKVGEIDMQIAPNYMLASVDSGQIMFCPFNLREELEA